MGTAGSAGLTSRQVWAVLGLPNGVAASALYTSAGPIAISGPLLASISTSPSMPMGISTTELTPFARQLASSDAFMRRDALTMSGVFAPTPSQNSLIPAPVPFCSMTGALYPPSLTRANCSATAVANG